jgi:hypothetical protein
MKAKLKAGLAICGGGASEPRIINSTVPAHGSGDRYAMSHNAIQSVIFVLLKKVFLQSPLSRAHVPSASCKLYKDITTHTTGTVKTAFFRPSGLELYIAGATLSCSSLSLQMAPRSPFPRLLLRPLHLLPSIFILCWS